MAEVVFNLEGINTIIQCNLKDKMKDIIDKFLFKIKENNNIFFYIYNGTRINFELTFDDQANKIDKDRKKMNVLVTKNNDNDKNDENEKFKEIKFNDIICPECNENVLLKIEDFKINLFDCKNNHFQENILLNIFEDIQKINPNDISCNICNNENKNKIDNNKFFICCTCDKTMCYKCQTFHDKNHKIINYIDKNCYCTKHKESFTKYCFQCHEDICIICENEHKKHKIIDFGKILVQKNDLNILIKDLKNEIDRFKNRINIMKQILNRMSYILDVYYKINEKMFNKYDMSKRNYHKLQNIYNLKIYGENLLKDLKNIIDEDKIYEYSRNNFYNEDGEKYFGDIKNGLKEGNGILFFNLNKLNRKRYEGNFKNNKIEGKGILFWNNGDRYEGDFINGARHGKGKIIYNNRSIYEGDWKFDKRNGKGLEILNYGDIYDGEWKNDKKEGQGKLIYNNGCEYNGAFKNNLREGKGKYTFSNGDIYIGDWKNNFMDGEGEMKYFNEDIYIGNWKNNMKEGKGLFLWKNGDKYDGEWKNDKKEGEGKMVYQDGKEENGNFKNDKFDKKLFGFW